jgi:ankyrin repeat protein
MMKFRLIQYLLIVVAIILVVRCVIGGEIERLLYAAKNNDIITVKNLLAKSEGIDINAVDEDGNTALMLAASLAKRDIVKALLAAGADVNVKNKKRNTALIIVA